MRFRLFSAVLLSTILISFTASTTPASAACKTLGFTVNHYGKEGPTNDAKRLLDVYIDSWTAERGITRFKKKKEKVVTCYKFLDFGFFDEWTCKAVQEVCFRGKNIPDVIATKKDAKKGDPKTGNKTGKTKDKAKSKTASTRSKAKTTKSAKKSKKYSKHYTRRMKYKKRSSKPKANQEG